MNKHRILIVIGLMLLFASIALATTSSATSDVIIYAFDQNPATKTSANLKIFLKPLSI